MIMRKRIERIHIRATVGTKTHWSMICKALGYETQSAAFADLMVEILNRKISGDDILKDIKDKRALLNSIEW